MAILSGVAHGRARVDIYPEVSIERSGYRFALGESELVEQVEDVVPLGDQYPDWCPNYFDAEEVMSSCRSFISNLPDKRDLTLVISARSGPPMTKSST